MFVGFLYVISAMSLRYASQGEAFIPDTYATVGNAIKMLHLFMFLEVLHPFFGYTKVRSHLYLLLNESHEGSFYTSNRVRNS